jgi:hypothetical protein
MSAQYWCAESGLLNYARRMQTTADWYSIGAALLAAITSLTVWTTLTNRPDWKAQLAVSVIALATAAVATFPRVRHYAEAAGKARELATQYGGLYGRLLDAGQVYGDPQYEDAIRMVIKDFDAVKARKDQLVPYPKTEQEARDRQKEA